MKVSVKVSVAKSKTMFGDVGMINQSLLEEQYKNAAPKKSPVRPKVGSSESFFVYDHNLQQEDSMTAMGIINLSQENACLVELEVSKCRIADCTFQQCDFSGSVFEDTLFTNCDFSNAILESVGFRRCEFVNCKFTGASFGESVFENVSLTDCNVSFASLVRVRWKNVSATTCDLAKSDMGEMGLSQVAFSDCRLTGANFFRTSLLGIDLTTCQIEGIVVSDSMAELRGVKMDIYQAVTFARKLGILIVE